MTKYPSVTLTEATWWDYILVLPLYVCCCCCCFSGCMWCMVCQWRWLLGQYLSFFFIQNMFIRVVSHSSWCRILLVLLPSEGASFCKPCFSSYRLEEDSTAASTLNFCLCMAKDGGDFTASWAFYIQEIGIRALYQALLLVFPLLFWRGMKKILCERHVLLRRSPLQKSPHMLYHLRKPA